MPGGKRKRAKGTEKKGDKRRKVAANLHESPRHKMIREMREVGYVVYGIILECLITRELKHIFTNNRHDGDNFASCLETSTENRARKGKPPKRNRYIHYCEWSYALLGRNPNII